MKLIITRSLKLFAICCIIQFQIHPIDSKEVLYYGFFFNSSVASSIKELTDYYLNTTKSQYDSFSDFLESSAASNNVTDPLKYFTKPLDPNTQEFDPEYHVTTKYCGDGIDCTAYVNAISDSLDKTFQMELVGFYFTNRTYGIRVKLTPDQEKLFENNFRLTSTTTSSPDESLHENLEMSNSYPGLSFVPIEDDTIPPTTNKPHITIGCAPGVAAVTTGTDLMKIISYELDLDNSLIDNTTLTINIDGQSYTDDVSLYRSEDNFTDEAFVIYPSMKILVNATFQPYFLPSSSYSIHTHHCLSIILSLLFASIHFMCF